MDRFLASASFARAKCKNCIKSECNGGVGPLDRVGVAGGCCICLISRVRSIFPASQPTGNWQMAMAICLTIMSGNYRIGRKFALPIAKNAVMLWAKGGGAQRAVGGGLWVVRVNIVQSFINSNNNRHCTCKWKCENGKCSRERSFFFFNCAYLSVK